MGTITHIDQLDLDKVYSYADYLKWRLKERIELIKGKVFKMSPAPSSYHQEISVELLFAIRNYLRGKKCKIYTAPFDVRLPIKPEKSNNKKTHTVVQPDLCVICDLDKIDERGCVGAPDLIVEILSPGNSQKEMQSKFDIYEESRVKEYWVVHPEENWVLVYILNEKGEFIGKRPVSKGEILKASIFPKLEIKLNDIFTQ